MSLASVVSVKAPPADAVDGGLEKDSVLTAAGFIDSAPMPLMLLPLSVAVIDWLPEVTRVKPLVNV